MPTATDDYILVRDKDGNLKYFKDGRYFDVDAMNTAAPAMTAKPLTDMIITPPAADAQVEANAGREAVRSEMNDKMTQTIDAIAEKLKLKFSDENIKKRFYTLVDTRLRGIRSDKEVSYMLTTPKDQGGIGLPAQYLDAVLTVIKNHEESFAKDQKDAAVKTVNAPATRPVEKTPTPAVPKTPYKPLIPLPEEGYDLAASLKQQGLATAAAEVKPVRKTLEPAPQKKMTDMSYRPTLTGPMDELRYMDIPGFHRLGGTPAQMAEEIGEKIAVLQEEHFPQRFAAIKAWRESPVHSLYLDMGTQSITENKPINDVIVARQVSNAPTLTKSEFDAIAALNTSLQM